MLLSVAFYVLVEEQLMTNRRILFGVLMSSRLVQPFHLPSTAHPPAALSAGNPQTTVTHHSSWWLHRNLRSWMEQLQLPRSSPGRCFPFWLEGAAAEGVSGECSTLS